MKGGTLGGRIFGALACVLAALFAFAWFWGQARIRQNHRVQVEARLDVAADLLEPRARTWLRGGLPVEEIRAQVADLPTRGRRRVTLVAPDGVVLADNVARLPLDNHAGRPEIQEAARTGRGASSRFSDSTGFATLYVAHRILDGEGLAGFLRVSEPLEQVEQELESHRNTLLLGGAATLLLGLLASWVLSLQLSRPLAEMERTAAAFADGDLSGRGNASGPAEFTRLAVSLNRMADQIRSRMMAEGRAREELESVLAGLAEGVVAVDAREGVLFERCFTPAPWTAPAHASLFTGLLPSNHGLRVGRGDRVRREVPLLAETLAARGYETVGVSANPHVSAVTGLDRGFRTFTKAWEGKGRKTRAEETAEAVRRTLEPILVGGRKPLFLFVNFLDPGQALLTTEYYWGPYQTLADHTRRRVETFRMFDASGRFNAADFERALLAQVASQGRALILLNSPCHNPTGYSLDAGEWNDVVRIVRAASERAPVALLVDHAYAKFGGAGSERWVEHVAKLVGEALLLVAWTASKSFTQYGARVGALVAVHPDAAVRKRLANALSYSCRGTWSNCNHAGMLAIGSILEDATLRARADAERAKLVGLLEERVQAFNGAAKAAGLRYPRYEGGFFVSVFTGAPEATAARMRELGVFVVPIHGAVRIALCSTPARDVPRLVAALAEGVKAH
ncbi:MAG: aminotransferase class I/II-fold pyridoxal phosphate-dependent enzyme [Planctomycetaceae bacterium]|nr:aminotransferase class I/II-fold pyridoxal phosphate-dependent enzyme [Planctomycetaceae bacterium]